MFRIGVYARTKEEGEWIDKPVGVVSFTSSKYANWTKELGNKFCEYEFEHGDLLGTRYKLGKVTKRDAEAFAIFDTSNALLIPRNGCSLTYLSEYGEDVRNVLEAVIEIQDTLVANPRASVDEAVENAYNYVKGMQF